MSYSEDPIAFLSFDYTNHVIKNEVLEKFGDLFDSGSYVLGNCLMGFETDYASFNEVDYAIGVSNGSDALIIALRCLGIGCGDEVIIPSNTCIATALAVSNTGATPVFVEPDRDTYNLDISRIIDAITFKTKAIIPVHLYGQACEMDKLVSFAGLHNLFIIEDNAQGHGALFKGVKTGSWGIVNATSFYPSKNLGAFGDAGAVTTNDPLIAQAARSLRNYGSERKYYNERIGYNMRMDEIQAVFLSVKLKYLPEWTQQRVQVAGWYDEQLKGVGDLLLPFVHKNATHVYHLYVVRSQYRDKLQEYLSLHRIGTIIHYPIPVHLQVAYSSLGYKRGDFPIAEEIADTCLSLPVWPGLAKRQVETVCQAIKQFFDRL